MALLKQQCQSTEHQSGLRIIVGQKLPLVIHEDAFRNRLVKFQGGRTINLPAPNRADLVETGYNLVEKQSQRETGRGN